MFCPGNYLREEPFDRLTGNPQQLCSAWFGVASFALLRESGEPYNLNLIK